MVVPWSGNSVVVLDQGTVCLSFGQVNACLFLVRQQRGGSLVKQQRDFLW